MQDDKENVDLGRDVTMKGKMFSFITKTWNPIAMKCLHECYNGGCWAEALKKGKLKDTPKYRDLSHPKLIEKELQRCFSPKDYVFVEDMGDLFGEWVPAKWIYKVLAVLWRFPSSRFLLLTKNPWRMKDFQKFLPPNVMCGATIETTRSMIKFSKAPATQQRYRAMKDLQHPHKMICIEPIVDFDPVKMLAWLTEIVNLELVVIGYNNYRSSCHLPEPSLAKTMKLIKELKDLGINVQTKTLREKNGEA